MNRVIMLLPDDLLAALDAAVIACGCGSRSVHLRHVLRMDLLGSVKE